MSDLSAERSSKEDNGAKKSADVSGSLAILPEPARRYLEQDVPANIHMLEAVRHREVRIVYAAADGVILIDEESGSCQISVSDPSLIEDGRLPEAELYCVNGTKCADVIRRFRKFPREMVTNQLHYPKNVMLPGDFSAVRPLSTKHSKCAEAYHAGPDYMKERIEAGAIFGYFIGDEPAGFIGLHDEGSVGLLEVFPAYRRRGIAANLLSYIANRLLAEGKVPYGQAELGNEASFALHEKLGFIRSDKQLYWLF